MKIFEIIPVLFDGGAERFIVDLSNELSKYPGVKVFLISLYNNEPTFFLKDELDPKVTLIELGKNPGFDFSMIRKLSKLIRKEKPDIVHSHLRAIEYLLPIMPFSKTKYVHTIHNDAFKECPGRTSRFIRKTFYNFNICKPITISEESSLSYQEAYRNLKNTELINGRLKVSKSSMYKNVLDEIESYKKSERSKVFINIARITKQKNQITLVKAFNRLVDEGYDIILLIIGRVENKEIYNEINKIKSDNIFLLESRSNPIDYLYAADAFCLSSIFEGMPITLIEAFQVGCIPICTPVGGVVNMIQNGINGILSEDTSVQSFAEMLRKFMDLSDEKKEEMSTHGKILFEKNYNIVTTTQNYIDVFLSI